ncbi:MULTISPECIES: hypothetical protein [Haloarcula]|uniref:hypothetical protein n=1 Tax=Haloarcula TaxID=2237 RepID=UPI0023E81309|nr:hypothetical protein [Halomicroarcula sp. SHR3]
MDDVGALQNTVRRCTAILVAAVGLAVYGLSANGSTIGLLLAVGGFGYVVLSIDETSGRTSDAPD